MRTECYARWLLLGASPAASAACASVTREDPPTENVILSLWYDSGGSEPLNLGVVVLQTGQLWLRDLEGKRHRRELGPAEMQRLREALADPLLGEECARPRDNQPEERDVQIESAACRAEIPYGEMGPAVRALLYALQDAIWTIPGRVQATIEWPGDYWWGRKDLLRVYVDGVTANLSYRGEIDLWFEHEKPGRLPWSTERRAHLTALETARRRELVASDELGQELSRAPWPLDSQDEKNIVLRTSSARAAIRCEQMGPAVQRLLDELDGLVAHHLARKLHRGECWQPCPAPQSSTKAGPPPRP